MFILLRNIFHIFYTGYFIIVFDTKTFELNTKSIVGDDACTDFTCFNGGTCKVTENDEAKCECLPGYDGDQCQISKIILIINNSLIWG